ncbi:hypothetical protein Csac_0230 [Caldicellulosiruptor saccharolyticus DSM 8903]|uniref:Uncharacterized protein n=1 Tax=Caldicellulosiruptor saccharolyticus (strain ATCC 43494 / DSM 8903 / Tp8T 6331) TaxID=351627 RepID=A4XG43_CALS8|nr:hypothetical protein [Caldicellulosiruptor saccharolyticus]ABP65878.1 hypothetical protein Csac_0230 [Caldicellulosiruptor saccharolyticus DSM 8903]
MISRKKMKIHIVESDVPNMEAKIELIKKYLETETKENLLSFIISLLDALKDIPFDLLPANLKDILIEWAETAEICLDDELMDRLKEAEEEFKSGGGIKWEHPTNST